MQIQTSTDVFNPNVFFHSRDSLPQRTQQNQSINQSSLHETDTGPTLFWFGQGRAFFSRNFRLVESCLVNHERVSGVAKFATLLTVEPAGGHVLGFHVSLQMREEHLLGPETKDRF